MTKMRVHELAKELGIENKELIEILQKKNVEVKNHMSSLEDSVADEIRREHSGSKAAKPEIKKAETHMLSHICLLIVMYIIMKF